MKVFSSVFRSIFHGAAVPRRNGSFFPAKPRKRGTGNERTSKSSASFPLTQQQEQVLRAIRQGRSVFLTGSAGTGKTILLKQAIDLLKRIHHPGQVFVTASTGVAACALNGQTLHSFAGVGLAIDNKETLLHMAASNHWTSYRWNRVKALIIDEISMIDGDFFDKLEFIARSIRGDEHKDQIWGGIQLIVGGDFFQLPPINSPISSKEFAFEADCWDSSFDLQIELTQVFRQSNNQLIDMLQGIRKGYQDLDHLQLLNSCCIGLMNSSSVTHLFPRNEDVKRVNDERLRSLGGEIIKYIAVDSGEEPWKSDLKQGIAPKELKLCLGARVMLIKNLNQRRGLVNGATGTIMGFVKRKILIKDICCSGLLPKVQFDSGIVKVIKPETWDVLLGETVLATRKQLPLILAWALSIHKCQGMTLDSIHTDLSRAFSFGMVYVALSRVRSLDGLYLSGFNPSKITAHPKVLQFHQKLHENGI